MENTLKYLNVGKSSDTSSKTDYSKVPNVQGDEVQKAEDSVNAQSLKPITIGNGKQIKQQSVKSGTKVLPHSKSNVNDRRGINNAGYDRMDKGRCTCF